jgi:hypothetical protein
MPDIPEERREPAISRSTILFSALGGVATLVFIGLMLFRVLDRANDAARNAADEQRQRDEQLRRQLEGIGGRPPAAPEPRPLEPADPANVPPDRLLAVALRDLESDDPALRRLAVSAIARRHLAEPAAVAALAKRVREDRDAEVRLAAVRALKSVNPRTPVVEEALRDAAKDADPRVRAEAAGG